MLLGSRCIAIEKIITIPPLGKNRAFVALIPWDTREEFGKNIFVW